MKCLVFESLSMHRSQKYSIAENIRIREPIIAHPILLSYIYAQALYEFRRKETINADKDGEFQLQPIMNP
jgi:hypothetical protein